ncbi:DgyrCDS8488 [Dimorphilus gyrociliatus]|uniref:DgyrCDS8488 n=1 Tax=Dimorphilus gyrociliatus TaxID=2664684 RepID=A0A7I8VVT8_9ANNE|nr:DgyrCDS8488 [Dimorphilus gyrociliatus]
MSSSSTDHVITNSANMLLESFGESSSCSSVDSRITLYSGNLKSETTIDAFCAGCGELITCRYLLKVSGETWHSTCLRCCICQTTLDRHTSCYIKEDHIYCKLDYLRHFGTKCSKCDRNIQPKDWVRRARENVYHLACFACDACKRQLSTGEEFALHENKVLCKTHYIELLEGGGQSDGDASPHKTKSKRVRTTFSEEQLQVLQANFQLDSNPDGQDLERIALATGLSKRVTQVWFQNSRARQKKHQAAVVNGSVPSPTPSIMSAQSGGKHNICLNNRANCSH